MNDRDFVLAADGWSQITPCGEFPHAGAGVTQVIDRAACDAIAADFNGRKAEANFPGVLVDFDHFSLDTGQSSEAAGWITELEARDTGLWARVRWSDAGLAAVQGGRFRLMSPVFPPPAACEDLGGGRIRPRALVSVALTNEPNIRGGKPLANRLADSSLVHYCGSALVENRGGGAKKYQWVLGDPPSGEHCDTCLARAGKIKTAVEWARMKPPPCNCHCSLEEVDDETANRWSNVAREASLAVRREKASRRKKSAISTVSELSGGRKTEDGEGEVSREDAKAQRLDAARAAVMRELAEKRSTFNAQRPTLK